MPPPWSRHSRETRATSASSVRRAAGSPRRPTRVLEPGRTTIRTCSAPFSRSGFDWNHRYWLASAPGLGAPENWGAPGLAAREAGRRTEGAPYATRARGSNAAMALTSPAGRPTGASRRAEALIHDYRAAAYAEG